MQCNKKDFIYTTTYTKSYENTKFYVEIREINEQARSILNSIL